MLSKEEIENNRIPKQLVKALGIEKEDTDSLIAFKESLYEQTAKENVKLKKQIEQLESEKQKLIEKLEKDIRKNNEFEFMPLQIEKAYNNYYKLGKIDESQEILKILKGENDGKRNN